jgi:hypothetical protein
LQEWCEPVKVPISERTAASSGTKAVYEVAWNCNMDLTKSGVRGEVVLDIAVQDFGCITLPIMAKVYRHEDTSAAHGGFTPKLLTIRLRRLPSMASAGSHDGLLGSKTLIESNL